MAKSWRNQVRFIIEVVVLSLSFGFMVILIWMSLSGNTYRDDLFGEFPDPILSYSIKNLVEEWIFIVQNITWELKIGYIVRLTIVFAVIWLEHYIVRFKFRYLLTHLIYLETWLWVNYTLSCPNKF